MSERQPIVNLEWMDEEVRNYRTELMAAQQRIDNQDEELRQQARHIEDLEGRLAGVLTQLNRLGVLERALDQYKEEIRLLTEQQEEAYQQDRREDARLKLMEQETQARTMSDVRKGLAAISEEIKTLAERARAGKLAPEEYRGGTLTISNLGMYGIRQFTPILNPPQACILGIGAGEKKPVVAGEEMVIATVMNCTLSGDHRALDGATAARFLDAFKRMIENPLSMLL